jgi:hypothetical protein
MSACWPASASGAPWTSGELIIEERSRALTQWSASLRKEGRPDPSGILYVLAKLRAIPSYDRLSGLNLPKKGKGILPCLVGSEEGA